MNLVAVMNCGLKCMHRPQDGHSILGHATREYFPGMCKYSPFLKSKQTKKKNKSN